MGRWKAWALAWLLAALLPALLLQAPAAQGDELLVNGGFENALGDEWIVATGEHVLDRVDTAGLVHSGGHAGALTCQASPSCALQQVVYDAGYRQEYEFKAYLLWNDSELLALSVSVRWFDEHGSEVERIEPVVDCTVEDDEPYHCLTTGPQEAPGDARFAKVKVAVVLKDGVDSSVIYLDDFSFQGAPAPTPSPTPTETPSATASPSPIASPSPLPEPTASPTSTPAAGPSPTAVPTATEMPYAATPSRSTPTPPAAPVNGGFEEADDEGRPLGWRKYGGELQRSSAARWEGQFAAAFTSRTASTKWAFQTVAVEGGKAYVLSGYALKNDANVQSAYLRLSWYASRDGSGRAIDSVDSTTCLADDSSDFRFLSSEPVVAPAEAASAKVRLMLDPVSEAEGRVYFDAISFEETTMPLPTQTAVPSPAPTEIATPPGATQTPTPPPPDDRESPTPPAVISSAPTDEPQPPSSPTVVRPSPTVLAASSAGAEATASPPQARLPTESPVAGTGTATPVVLYRERRASQSIQAGGDVAAGADEGDGLPAILLVLAIAAPAAAAAATAFFVWQRWVKRARPP